MTASHSARDAADSASIAGRLINDATLQGKGLFGALTGSAWDRWKPLQERVNTSLTDQQENLDPAVYQARIADQSLKRFGELTRQRVIDDNLSNWFK